MGSGAKGHFYSLFLSLFASLQGRAEQKSTAFVDVLGVLACQPSGAEQKGTAIVNVLGEFVGGAKLHDCC